MRCCVWVAGFVAVLSLPTSIQAQGIEPGRWTGFLRIPNGSIKPVTYTVTRSRDSVEIALYEIPPGGPLPFNSVREKGDSLHITWNGGPNASEVICDLGRQSDGSYDGPCYGFMFSGNARMHMTPPPKE